MEDAAPEANDKLLAARNCLKDSLKKSEALASKVERTGARLEGINQRLPLLMAEVRSTYTRGSTLFAIRGHVNRAFGPVSAVLTVYDAVLGLERSLPGDPGGDILSYLALVKQLEEALRLLSDNCGLAVQWMEDIVRLLDDNVKDDDDQYILIVRRSLRILKELKAMEVRARLHGGMLSTAFDKLEFEFRRLIKESSVPNSPSRYPENAIQKLHAIIERLRANERLENCLSIYVDVRSSSARAALQGLNLDYLDLQIRESDSVQTIEDQLALWAKHVEYAVKRIFQTEYELSERIFEKIGPDFSMGCFAKIAAQSGFLALLHFGSRVAETKKDAIKLLKLLEMFAVLDKLRLDFNRLFSGKACLEIQTLTRDLIKRIVNGTCEIFKELSVQVEMQRYSMTPPLDGSIPRLVTFVTNYCLMLLEDEYRPILTQVLSIHQIWNHEKSKAGLIRRELQKIVTAMEINIETWSKTFEENTLANFFLMNNYRYLYDLTKGTFFEDLMGNTWLKGYRQKMECYTATYLKESWANLSAILSEDGLILFSPGRTTARDLVKKRLKEFNETFDEMYKKQSQWVVYENGMREKTCQIVVRTVVPPYRYYLQNYAFLVEKGSSPSKYVKYSAASMEAMLSSLFQPKMTKYGSTKPNHLIGKIRSVVANQFRVTPVST